MSKITRESAERQERYIQGAFRRSDYFEIVYYWYRVGPLRLPQVHWQVNGQRVRGDLDWQPGVWYRRYAVAEAKARSIRAQIAPWWQIMLWGSRRQRQIKWIQLRRMLRW